MNQKMDWLFTVLKIAGTTNPLTAPLVQATAEMESHLLKERLEKLEDPISSLHKDVQDLSKQFYNTLKSEEYAEKTYPAFEYNDDFYKKYSKTLAVLESKELIKGSHSIGKKFAAGLIIYDPVYIMYICALFENQHKMDRLVRLVESCEVGNWLDGKRIREEIDLPLTIIKAVFDIFESKGYGLCSKELRSVKYVGKA